MSAAQQRGPSPIASAASKGDTAMLLASFRSLSATGRAALLADARNHVRNERDAKLPPRARKISKLVEQHLRCLDLLNSGETGSIQLGLWRSVADDTAAELEAMGISYFAGACHA